MKAKRLLCVGIAALAAIGLCASPAAAGMLIGFEFAPGVTSQKVPLAGGAYEVMIYAQGTEGVTQLGVQSGYIGALSEQLLPIAGNVTGTPTMLPQLGALVGVPLADRSSPVDGHIDLGNRDGAAKDEVTWYRPNAGANPYYPAPAVSKFYLGSFTVTVPAYTTGAADNTPFLKYNPQLNPGGLGSDWNWGENGGNKSGSLGTAQTGVLLGTSVTLMTEVPEPSVLALVAGGALASIVMLRRRLRRS